MIELFIEIWNDFCDHSDKYCSVHFNSFNCCSFSLYAETLNCSLSCWECFTEKMLCLISESLKWVCSLKKCSLLRLNLQSLTLKTVRRRWLWSQQKAYLSSKLWEMTLISAEAFLKWVYLQQSRLWRQLLIFSVREHFSSACLQQI